MASLVGIANAALAGDLGQEQISALDEDHDIARKVNAVFYIILDEALRTARPAFARKQAALALLTDAPLFGFSKQFQLPTDFVVMVKLNEQAENDIEFTIQGSKLLWNEATANLLYIYKCYDPNLFDALFVAYFKKLLAAELAWSICQNRTLQEQKLQEAELKLRECRGIASQSSGSPEKPPTSRWIAGRA